MEWALSELTSSSSQCPFLLKPVTLRSSGHQTAEAPRCPKPAEAFEQDQPLEASISWARKSKDVRGSPSL